MLKTNIKRYIAVFILAGAVSIVAAPAFSAGTYGVMSKEELKGLLDSDRLTILDVRTGRDWNSSEFKIQGAQRAASDDFEQWSASYAKDKILVLYCA